MMTRHGRFDRVVMRANVWTTLALVLLLSFGYARHILAAQPASLDIVDAPAANVKVRLYDMSFTDATNFTGKLSVQLPQNNLTDIPVSGTYDEGTNTLAVTVSELKLKLASIELNLQNVSISRNQVSAGTANLVLPAKLGGSSGTVNDIKIDNTGLTIGSGVANFTVPDIKLGSSTGFAMTGVKGSFEVTADKVYKVTLAGTVAVNIPQASVSVTGSVWVDSTGNIGGKLEAFSISVAGLTLEASSIEFDADGSLKIASASLQAPEAWRGGPGASVTGVRISPADGGSVTFESAKFKLPTIKAGGFSLGEGEAELLKVGNGYEIGGKVSFSVPYLGKAVGCEGISASLRIYVDATGQTRLDLRPSGQEWALVSNPQRMPMSAMSDFDRHNADTLQPDAISGFALREVSLALSCQIPIGNTGFFLDSISGSLTLNQGTAKITVGLGISALKKVMGVSVLSATAQASLQANPFEMAVEGAVKMFIWEVANAKATLTAASFKATLNLNIIVLDGAFSVNAWNDQRGFFFTASGEGTLGILQGKISSIPIVPYLQCPDGKVYLPGIGPCWYSQTKWATGKLDIPPTDLKLGSVKAEAGAFEGDKWGFKGSVTVLGISYGFFIDTQGNLSVTNVDQLKLVTPQQVAMARSRLQAAFRANGLSAAEVQLDGTTFGLSPQGDVTIDVPITRTQDMLFSLSRDSDLPEFSLISPSGDPITSGTTLENVRYEENVFYKDGVYPQPGEMVKIYLPLISKSGTSQNLEFTDKSIASAPSRLPTLQPLPATLPVAPDIEQLPHIMTADEARELFPETFPAASKALSASSAPAPQARLRFLQASPDATALDVWVDGSVVLSNVSFKDATPYLTLTPGSHAVKVVPAGASTPEYITATVALSDSTDYTFVAAGSLASIQSVLLVDQNRPLPIGQPRMRFGNLSPDAGAVDLALQGGQVITGFANLTFKGIANYTTTLPGGTYTLEVRTAGTSTVLLTVPGVTFRNDSVYSLFLMGTAGNLQLATNLDDTDDKANVRFVQAVPDLLGAVDVRLNNGNAESKVFSNVGFATTLYSSQFADTYRFRVVPAGLVTPVYISPSLNMGLGQDYTVLAVGTLANIESLVLTDTNTLPQVDQVRVRLVNASPDAPALKVVATGGPEITTPVTLFDNVSFKGVGSYTALAGGTYTLEVRNTSDTVLLTVPETFEAGRVYSLFAMGRVGGTPSLRLVSAVDIIAQVKTDVKYAVDGAEPGTWKMVLGGNFDPVQDKYIVNTSGNVPAPVLTDVSAAAIPGTNTADVNWTLSSYEDANINIYANNGAITDTLMVSATGTMTTTIVPIYQGNELELGLDSPVDGTPYSKTVDLSWLHSGVYRIYVEAEAGENEPVQMYAPEPITVDNTGSWPLTWTADVSTTQVDAEGQLVFDGIDLQWEPMAHPDVDGYVVYWGTSSLSLTEVITVGETTWETISPVDPGDTVYFSIGADDTETGREARSQVISVTAMVGEFSIAPEATQFNVIGGQSVATVVTLTTALDTYPDAVYLDVSDVISEGIDVDWGENDFVVPITSGLPVSLTISTSDSLPDGEYSVPIVAVGAGVTHTLDLTVSLAAPGFVMTSSVQSVDLTSVTSVTLVITTTSIYSSTDPIFLEVPSPPLEGLAWDWSDEVAIPGESVMLTLSSTVTYSGTHTLQIAGDNGIKLATLDIEVVGP